MTGSTLTIQAEEAHPVKSARLKGMPAGPHAAAGPADTFAPAPKGCRCRDCNGYKRPEHAFDKDGVCCFCGRAAWSMRRR